MDQINLGAWIDRTDTIDGGVSPQQAALIHSVLGAPGSTAPRKGDLLPHLWHWYAFPPLAAMEELGEDGHPRLGDFMPPVRLNRRMWAGGSLEFLAPVHVGEPLRRRSRIADVVEKTSASGPIVIVTLDHEIHGQAGLAVLERQDIVYLQIPEAFKPPRKTAAPKDAVVTEAVKVTTPLLFRYSAITFNAHRIHYDLPYTQQVEHYPDLVVHGPLQAQLLINTASRQRGHAPRLFSYRGVHPLFAGDALDLRVAALNPSEWVVCAVANGTHQTMQANAIWEI